MLWLVSPYWLNLIGIELLDLLHMFLDVICKSIYGAARCCPVLGPPFLSRADPELRSGTTSLWASAWKLEPTHAACLFG